MSDVKWIKITTDIFDDEKILLIESLPDADSLIVIWFKLLCLAGKQNNSGVFMINENIAYTEDMLATIFRRPLNTVRLALDAFEKYGMIEVIDGVITIPNWGKHQNLDSIERKREYQRELMRKRRAEQKLLCEANSKANSKANVSLAEEEKNKNKKENKKKNNIYYPNDEVLNQAFEEYVSMRKQIKAPMTDRAVELAIKKLNDLSKGDNDVAVAILNQSVLNSWKGLFPLRDNTPAKSGAINWDEV